MKLSGFERNINNINTNINTLENDEKHYLRKFTQPRKFFNRFYNQISHTSSIISQFITY